MMDILLLRHGMTEGNKYKRYIGVTDEPLCPEGEEMLHPITDFVPDVLFASPLLRCRQTARILFPGTPHIVIPELAEMNFGIFENRSFQEDLCTCPQYQEWIDSRCEAAIPEGESKAEFEARCIRGFEKAMETAAGQGARTAAFSVHGGTIMSILSRYADEKKEYYEWYAENGRGYAGAWNGNTIKNIRKL